MSGTTEKPRPRPEGIPQDGSGGNGPGGALEALQRAGQDLLSAGDAAINRALETDSETFLRASRQQGGQ
ncbi:MAG: hypothetical protein GF328_13780 [Candidatus Latescibacteria bacterium]|nr:hypothetical protein [Candidatus Latescibacterota bacterium]